MHFETTQISKIPDSETLILDGHPITTTSFQALLLLGYPIKAMADLSKEKYEHPLVER